MARRSERQPPRSTRSKRRRFRPRKRDGTREAQRLWARILELDPNHVRTLSVAGPARVRAGATCRTRASRSSASSTSTARIRSSGSISRSPAATWGRSRPRSSAIRQALDPRPRRAVGLILRANLLERQGQTHRGGRSPTGGRRGGAATRPAAAPSCGPPSPRRTSESRSTIGTRRPSSTSTSNRMLRDVRGRGPEAISRCGRHHGRPQASATTRAR